MIVKCEKCQASFNLDSSLIKENGSAVRCSNCKNIFKLYPSPPADEKQQTPSKSSEPTPVTALEIKEEEYLPEPQKYNVERHEKVFNEKRKYTPFKTRLIYFPAILIGLMTLGVITIEAYRPIKELYHLIDKAKILIAGTQAAFDFSDLEKMNSFALKTISHQEGNPLYGDRDFHIYSSLVFNMLLEHGKILSEEKVLGRLEYLDYFEAFDYAALLNVHEYWKKRFFDDPGILEIFQKYKRVLMQAKESTVTMGFPISEIYIWLDTGRKEGAFTDNIAFLLDSAPWWSGSVPSFSGLLYGIEPEYEYLRDLTLTGRSGYYGHNPISDPENYYLPRFVEDPWGTWFTVWLTKKTGQNYNQFSIDFDAGSVKKLMWKIIMAIVGVIIVQIIIVSFFAKRISRLVNRPITELTKGVKAVTQGNYDYEVTVISQDEFGDLILQFNRMTKQQKERLRLLEVPEIPQETSGPAGAVSS